MGYVFPWGHVIESPPGPRSPDGDHDERHPICSWDFCLDEALADHHNAGLSLNDLTEHALVMLDEMQTHHLWWPEIRYGDGESASTFDLWVMGEENIVLARRWLDEVFLTVFMVDVLSGVATVCRHIAQERDESGAR